LFSVGRDSPGGDGAAKPTAAVGAVFRAGGSTYAGGMTSSEPAAERAPKATRDASVASVRTNSRIKNRRKAAPAAKIGMICFFIGGLAILADLIIFASGNRNLPLWLNLLALLAPIGLGVGLLGVLLENRRAAKARAAAG
jgi:hypothetical protein